VLLVWCTAAAAAYTFYMVGSVCAKTQTHEWGAAWSATVGEASAWLPRLAVLSASTAACVIYSMILGDTLAAGVHLIISKSSALSLSLGPYCNRGAMLAFLTPLVLFLYAAPTILQVYLHLLQWVSLRISTWQCLPSGDG